MNDFVPGERVKILHCQYGGHGPVNSGIYIGRNEDDEYRVALDDGTGTECLASRIARIRPEFRVGDAVRLLPIEGRVGWVSDDKTHVRLDYHSGGGELLHVRNLARIGPSLPTTRGSLIRNNGSRAYWYHDGTAWQPANPSTSGGSTDGVGSPWNYTVIFDAGASS